MITSNTTTKNFLELLGHWLKSLKPHDYINKQQSEYLKQLKGSLEPGEIFMLPDYSKNFAFVVQKAAQAFHYNNNQATVYTVVYYYRDKGELKHGNIIVISESNTHDSAVVYVCNSMTIDNLKKPHKVTKIIYFSNRANQHFKNRLNIQNLCNHENDCGLKAEWHFCATSYGKDPHDGLGAAFKIGARNASLQHQQSTAF